jgi:hypothetical protein
MFCLDYKGIVYAIHDMDDYTVYAVLEKNWLSPRGDIAVKPIVRVIARRRMLVIHRSLMVVKGWYIDPELQDAIERLEQLQMLGERHQLYRLLAHTLKAVVISTLPALLSSPSRDAILTRYRWRHTSKRVRSFKNLVIG